MEHFYQTIGENWFLFDDLYKDVVYRFGDGSHFVEVGAWKGRSASFMAVEIINSGYNIKFDVVDTWDGSAEHKNNNLVKNDLLYNEFLKNTESVSHVINPIRMTSEEASKLYEDESLNFVFIDAAHDYQSVKNDINLWLPKVKKGGILGGDDMSWSGVVRAVNEIFGDSKELYGRQSWVFEK